MVAAVSLVLYDPQATSPEVRTIAGFLGGYSGRNREAYTLDRRMSTGGARPTASPWSKSPAHARIDRALRNA